MVFGRNTDIDHKLFGCSAKIKRSKIGNIERRSSVPKVVDAIGMDAQFCRLVAP